MTRSTETPQARWQPTLRGETLWIRPLLPSDFESLFHVASDPLIWEQHSARDRYQRGPFQKFFEGALESGGALAILSQAGGDLIGSSRYYDWSESDRSIIVGYTFLKRTEWGSGRNLELKKLMLDHAFIYAERAWFQVSHGNLRSRRALEKLGAIYSHDEEVRVSGVQSSRMIYTLDRKDWSPSNLVLNPKSDD